MGGKRVALESGGSAALFSFSAAGLAATRLAFLGRPFVQEVRQAFVHDSFAVGKIAFRVIFAGEAVFEDFFAFSILLSFHLHTSNNYHR